MMEVKGIKVDVPSLVEKKEAHPHCPPVPSTDECFCGCWSESTQNSICFDHHILTELLIVDHMACCSVSTSSSSCTNTTPDLPCLQIFLLMQHFVGCHASPDELRRPLAPVGAFENE